MKSNWWIWLDDVRQPASGWGDLSTCIHATSYVEFVDLIARKGCPSYIAFDHDLGYIDGTDKSGYDCAKFLTEMWLNNPSTLPDDFSFTIHSMNPVGANNIRNLLNPVIEHVRKLQRNG